MRNVIDLQMSLGQKAIEDIVIDVTSRDDIPLILLGLQQMYNNKELREAVFKILEEILPTKTIGDETTPVSSNKGRPGMSQWTILVIGTLRLGLNADYDRILELVTNHKTIREMLGLTGIYEDIKFSLQTLKDNVGLFTVDILARISAEVIKAGYKLLGADINEINGKCDSFVVETDVEFPTDIHLLYEAIRVLTRICVNLSKIYQIPGWRQFKENMRRFKKLYRRLQKLKRSKSQDESKKKVREAEIKKAYQEYIDHAKIYLDRANASIKLLKDEYKIPDDMLSELHTFAGHAKRQIDQIRRRAILGEVIPHEEKVFSLFEPHTEWISKGKAGVQVELGLLVCIISDKYGFILKSMVMEKTTDDKVAVPIVKSTQEQFPNFKACSFDKGFHSPENQRELKNILDEVVLPKKGKLSKADKVREYAPEFVQAKMQHSSVESSINALEVHGLDRCPDHGIDAFKRYVGLAALSRNIQILGAIKRGLERERLLLERQKLAA